MSRRQLTKIQGFPVDLFAANANEVLDFLSLGGSGFLLRMFLVLWSGKSVCI